MTEEDIIRFARGLPGVRVQTGDEANGAPEIAWGDSFIYYDPDDTPDDKRFPFATIVIKDYPGFDEASQLNRTAIFRLNVSAGRERFTELIGYPPAQHREHADDIDYTALDTVLPHPEYGQQAWVSILNPSSRTSELARALIMAAHDRAAARHAYLRNGQRRHP